MRVNLPVSQRNYEFPGDELLVSITNTKGEITHCNGAFARVSGYSYDELMGQPHNLIRHPDMPEAAFKDMWRTIGQGFPWTGLVKNRRKNGDHYWVRANVTPILDQGRPRGYMSVRSKPTASEIDAAAALYAGMQGDAAQGRSAVQIRGGQICYGGLRGWGQRLGQLGLTARMGLQLGAVAALALLPDLLGLQGQVAWISRLLLLAGGSAVAMALYQRQVVAGMREAARYAADVAGCNLSTQVRGSYPGELGELLGRLQQIQINLRAVVGDVRTEITGVASTADEVARGSLDLSQRTEVQAGNLQQTAASMEELSGTVSQTADTAQTMSKESDHSSRVASQGGRAIQEVGDAMEHIRGSSTRMSEIIGVIESIAFQTNILALNAAVEAARAGEQGRGFAVVASEVRALAQRSATAAKEISGLITKTVDGINDGNQRMAQAGKTIEGMVEAVERVGGLVHQISIATREQSVGIQQVNEAVLQLDLVTQQNVAMVEESSASAEALRASVYTLKRSVDVFTLR